MYDFQSFSLLRLYFDNTILKSFKLLIRRGVVRVIIYNLLKVMNLLLI